MKASLAWIRQYVPDLNVGYKEFMDAMTLSGTKVEYYEQLDKNLEKIVVGQIEKIEKHPDADKLVVCQVNVGTETVQIVTGAPNIVIGESEGAKVPVVLDGGRVAGGHDGGPLPENGIKIKKGKLRGVESFGMMCSVEELGQSRDSYPLAPENGIYIFPEDTEVGADAIEVFGLHDAVYEFEITSNRVDCYSIIGIAREVAATFGLDFVPPHPAKTGNDEDISDYVSVEVADRDLCRRYMARGVKNIKIGPSPEWFQRLLAKNGHRPINNLVDITNFILDEYGQPMHAFDMDQIAGRKIIVKRAEDGDEFQTLDGKMHTLDHDVLMICDAEREIGLAGIMGGENSKVTDDVTKVLFECACFDGTNNRLASKRLGLRTDSSAKYEKGLDPNNCEEAVNRACELVELFGCGEVIGGVIDVKEELPAPKRIPFRPDWINAFLGTDIPEADMREYFRRLELEVDDETGEVIAPTFRQDLEAEADIAEEVARMYGYDNIPTTLPKGSSTMGGLPLNLRVQERLQDVAEYCGFSQSMTYSFESPKVYDKLRLPEDHPLRKAVVISNPLGEDFSIMRTLPVNGLLTSLGRNYNRRNKDVRLYELAKVYIPKALPLTELPDERVMMTLGFYGEGDFFDMKGVVEEMLVKVGMRKKMVCEPGTIPFLHPGRQAYIIYDGDRIGYLGELHPETADAYEIGGRVYIAVLDTGKLMEHIDLGVTYEGLAMYPEISRDLSMLMDSKIRVGVIEEVIEKYAGPYLESYRLFDVYEGERLGEGKKSVAYNLVFRAKDRTLEDADVSVPIAKILEELEKLGIELRK
ncbi:MAG: phenylalanine--tRNA ligase subunit beta [Lachnospiraceae bacterium]|nr:phenylalanine--tRNA ligase subunit beta [Lachnospiraceae bacterium]